MKTNAMTSQRSSLFSTRKMVVISLLAALSYVLMLFHLPFKFLGFLEFEFSDIPAVIAALQFGPLAGVVVELVKNLIKALTASTTGTVGELANFLISSAYIIPVGILYKLRTGGKLRFGKTEKNEVKKSKAWNGVFMTVIFVVGTAAMALAGALLNYYVMLPLYAKLFGGMDTIVGIAASNVSAIKDLGSLVILGITPFNIVKGIYISAIGYYTFRILKGRVLQ